MRTRLRDRSGELHPYPPPTEQQQTQKMHSSRRLRGRTRCSAYWMKQDEMVIYFQCKTQMASFLEHKVRVCWGKKKKKISNESKLRLCDPLSFMNVEDATILTQCHYEVCMNAQYGSHCRTFTTDFHCSELRKGMNGK